LTDRRVPGRRTVGVDGEAAAAAWYQARGYEIVARNWRCNDGELDVVARRGSTLVFCEVKARTSNRFGTPFEAVTAAKQRKLRGLALRYLRDTGTRTRDFRFDVAAVTAEGVEVLEHAF
jgi:putative endonuclease